MIGFGTVNINFLNVTYNLADFVNKILFGLNIALPFKLVIVPVNVVSLVGFIVQT